MSIVLYPTKNGKILHKKKKSIFLKCLTLKLILFHMKEFFTTQVSHLFATYKIVANKARQVCLYQAVLGIIKSRNVQLPALADAIKLEGDSIQTKSIIHRLEDFFRETDLDYQSLALLLVCCLGEGKIRLCIDRTEWDFGKRQVNILMITASTGARQVPLYWELLDNKSGNSNSSDRIDLLKKIIDLVGADRIGIVIGDREFIGHKWLNYLKDKGIDFCMRVPKHHLIERFDGQKQNIEDLASQKPVYLKNCQVDGVWVNVYLKKIKDGDYLFLIGTIKEPKYLGQI